MKYRILILITLMFAIFSCEEENKVEDPIYEFASFKGTPEISLNENLNSVTPYPVVVQLYAFNPYAEDITLSLEISGNNAEEDADFTVTPSESLRIKAGSLVSDTLWIKTIDNASGSTEERSFNISISSISKPDIKIGLGINEPKNAALTVTILDDECSATTSIFNSDALVNTLNWGEADVTKPATGAVVGNAITVTGDLIDYSPFSDASITITLTPESDGSTKGTATFGEQAAGTDDDGYEYKFIEVNEGIYDVCNGTINIEYDIYYMDGDWVYWYTVTNQFSVE